LQADSRHCPGYNASEAVEGVLSIEEIAQFFDARRLTMYVRLRIVWCILSLPSRTIPFLGNSKGRLAVDFEMYKDIMKVFQISNLLNDFAAYFRYKKTENDFAHPPCVFRPLLPDEVNATPNGYGE
jgi:hypothetical protein